MVQHHIYIYGDIYNDQSEFAQKFGSVSVSQVAQQLNQANNANAKEIIVHIHSRGGDVNEGFAIHDLLVTSGFHITTIIEGLCASIASVIALAGADRKMTSNSEFFIHNPWGEPDGMSGYTANDYAKRAYEIKQAEDKLLDFYVLKTGGDRELIAKMMEAETTLSATEAMEMKFITDIVQTINAKAYLNSNQNIFHKMKEVSTIKNALNRVLSFLDGKSNNIVALDLTLEDGTPIVVETTESEPKVGDAVTINGEPAPDGEHMLSDGTMIVVAGGKIAEMKKIEVEDSMHEEEKKKKKEEEMAELVNAYTKLSVQNKELERENIELKSSIGELREQVTQIQSRIKNLSSGFVPQGRTGDAGAKRNEAMDDVASRVALRKKSLTENKK
jgi:ATP-dependent Clp endopeptidase proteolytic subunit ClpP